MKLLFISAGVWCKSSRVRKPFWAFRKMAKTI